MNFKQRHHKPDQRRKRKHQKRKLKREAEQTIKYERCSACYEMAQGWITSMPDPPEACDGPRCPACGNPLEVKHA